VVRQANNQALAFRPTHEHRCVHMISERTPTKSKTNFSIHVGNLPKKFATGDKIEPLRFQRVGFENEQLGVTWFGHLIVPSRMGKCRFQHVLLHLEE